MKSNKPRRKVVDWSGGGSMGIFDLVLSCGHKCQRVGRYAPGTAMEQAPATVICYDCPPKSTQPTAGTVGEQK